MTVGFVCFVNRTYKCHVGRVSVCICILLCGCAKQCVCVTLQVWPVLSNLRWELPEPWLCPAFGCWRTWAAVALCPATGRPHPPPSAGDLGGAQTGRLQPPVHCSGASLENRMGGERWTQAWTPTLPETTRGHGSESLGGRALGTVPIVWMRKLRGFMPVKGEGA